MELNHPTGGEGTAGLYIGGTIMEKVVIIGANQYQDALICKAKAMGLERWSWSVWITFDGRVEQRFAAKICCLPIDQRSGL